MLLNKIYSNLLPIKDYLIDEVVLLNAWKKAHQHIRRMNSYVDCLDLDKSALELDKRISHIASSLDSQSLKLSELKLIPIPKSHAWEFEEENNLVTNEISFKWTPTATENTGKLLQPMRPLAHISINDQVLFTALMMLLANKVETIQGDPSTVFESVHEKKVINYGNRLYCRYKDDEANYSWGNSNVYSKFFKDYQQFLSRPIYFGRKARQVKASDEQIYEVHLDFAKFYDLVDRTLLIKKISNLVKDITNDEPDSGIKYVLDAFENWEWNKDSIGLYYDVCRNEDVTILENKKGIPQGLVAGGFFANIYMLNFDNVVSNYIGKPLFENDLVLIDACRYVDDLRLIVKANKFKYTEKEIAEHILSAFKEDTEKLCLNIQKTKTKVKVFSSKEGAISSKLADIQSKVSGPMPLHELDEQLGHLEGLIELSDNLNVSNKDYNKVKINFVSQLAFIDTTFNDIRKDTILRFTANKIHNLLKQKRNMISQDVNDVGEPIAGSWDYLQERIARKLISKWAKDPSLTLLLKKGLELFPHIDLLRPIIQNLESVRKRNNKELVLLAEYCLSEILRHSATVIHIKDKWSFPAHSDYQGYFRFLENYASSQLNDIDDLHDALREQILFFCLIRNDSALKNEVSDKTFNIITQIINGFRIIDIDVDKNELTTAILLAYQIALDKNKVIRSIESTLEILNEKKIKFNLNFQYIDGLQFVIKPKKIENKAKSLDYYDLESICRTIMLGDPKLFEIIYKSSRKQGLEWHKEVRDMSNYLGFTNNSKVQGKISNYNNKKISLLAVLRSDDNPFRHENGILMILRSILKQFENSEIPNPIDISNCTVECSDWDSLLQLNNSTKLDVKINYLSTKDKFFHSPPIWLIKEHYSLYYLGMFIRNCLLGLVDWSGNLIPDQDKPAYRGIKSNLLKRQIGIAHSPEIFGDSKSPMSNWLSSLLFKLLQWPGVDNSNDDYDWPKNWNLSELNKLIKNRAEIQRKGFCRLTNIPTYVEKVNLNWNKDKKCLNVMMVQPLLPMEEDFSLYGLKLDQPKYRAKHRRHIASVAELILHNIETVDNSNEKPKLKGKVDLIIWPELSVSPDDLDILERLSDKTGAIIFAGISFSHINNDHELNNAAIWIIPNQKNSGRRFIKRLQGKYNMTIGEIRDITPWRPYQLIIELLHPAFKNQEGFKLTGSICYDATDIELSADLKSKSNAYIISAMNKDVATFDSMLDSLFYHMYQYVVLVNSGEFGGSVAKAPYSNKFDKLITHTHGSHQVSISSFEMNMFDFRDIGLSMKSNKPIKTRPAGNKK